MNKKRKFELFLLLLFVVVIGVVWYWTKNIYTKQTAKGMVITETLGKTEDGRQILRITTYTMDTISIDTLKKRELSTLERDIQTPSKPADSLQILDNQALFDKVYSAVGKDGVELWITIYCTDWEVSDTDMELFRKTDKIIQDNYKSLDHKKAYDLSWDFHNWVAQKYGKYDKDNTWEFIKNGNNPQTIQMQYTAPKIKDFSQTAYSDEFVNKYKIEQSNIKNQQDTYFDSVWNNVLRQIANYLQQYCGDYDYGNTLSVVKLMWGDAQDLTQFLSYDCRKDYENKLKNMQYKMNDVLKTKKL